MSKRWTLQLISVLNWRPSVYSLSLSSLFANLPLHLLALLTGFAFCVIWHNTDSSDCLILEFYRQCQWKLVIGIRQFRALVFHNCDWWTLGRVNCTVVHSFFKTTIAVRNNIPSLSLSPTNLQDIPRLFRTDLWLLQTLPQLPETFDSFKDIFVNIRKLFWRARNFWT